MNLLALLKDGDLLSLSHNTTLDEAQSMFQTTPNIGRPRKNILLARFGNLELTFLDQRLYSAMVDLTDEDAVWDFDEATNGLTLDSILSLASDNDLQYGTDKKTIPVENSLRLVFPSGAQLIVHEGFVVRAYRDYSV